MANLNYWVRYYSQPSGQGVHDALVALLREIASVGQVRNEVIQLRLVPSPLNNALLVPDEVHEKEIYERDFLPRWQLLNAQTGTRLGKVLRTRSRRYCIAGTLAVVSEQGVEWYSTGRDRFATGNQDSRVGFLNAVLRHGPGLFAELCTPVFA